MGGEDLQDATDGIVTRSYITNLRKGRIENPGYDKLAAIARAMGFPPRLWFEDVNSQIPPEVTEERLSLSTRINRLFDTLTDDRTGAPYTDAEVARMSLGALGEDEVEGMRTGRIPHPTLDKIVALSGVFGVDPAYFLGRGDKPPIIDREVLDIFRDETASAIARKILRLSGNEKRMILNIIDELENMRRATDQEAT